MENKSNNNTEVIDLKEVFMYLISNIVIILLATMIGAMGMFLLSKQVMREKFQSSTKIYVLNQQDTNTVTYSDLQTGTQLTKDYSQLVTSRTVTSKVIAELDLQNKYKDMEDITPEELADMVSVTIPQDTRIIKITVTDTDPTRAQDIANAIRVAASAHIYSVMDIEAVNVVDYANLPEKPVSPNVKKNVVIGALLGFVIACAVFTIIFIVDDTIKTPDDVERYLGLSVLASIPFDETMENAYGGNAKKKGKNKGRPATTNRTAMPGQSTPKNKIAQGTTVAQIGKPSTSTLQRELEAKKQEKRLSAQTAENKEV